MSANSNPNPNPNPNPFAHPLIDHWKFGEETLPHLSQSLINNGVVVIDDVFSPEECTNFCTQLGD
jgi:hypothetical protein